MKKPAEYYAGQAAGLALLLRGFAERNHRSQHPASGTMGMCRHWTCVQAMTALNRVESDKIEEAS